MVIIYVLVVTEVGKENEIAKELSKIKGVTEAKTVYGEFDVVARIEAENLKEVDEIITTVRKVSGIIRTVTLISA
ncbi:Lrp/AsnC family transcriptional regulator [Candidatus Bathyarchaeota archaeon]|nr:MAG: Lrp/AsnC family transcriptional regulator [Candidatus Hecatellales archaeon]RLI34593.1 MAG: Lrp/AsnC family transcriptional regulator [Candidatus Bathyarchaeota archaeon]